MGLDNSEIAEKSLKCIRCGFCLDACPTFRLIGNEADSPRGRIYLMRSVSEGALPLGEGVRNHIDACLGCRACETACPSGVEYAAILEGFRASLEVSPVRPAPQRFARKQLLGTLTNPRRLALALKAARLLDVVIGERKTMPGIAGELLTGKPGVPVVMPSRPDEIRVGNLPEFNPAASKKRFTVAILAGCVMRVLFHETNEATVRVLQRNGCDVIVPKSAGCCGALHLHSGYLEEARTRARSLLDSLNLYEIDAFVVNSAGCGSTLREYGQLLADDPTYAERAEQFAASLRDISEFLEEIEIDPPAGRFEATVAYHDACHLAHGQRIVNQPRSLLKRIPGLNLVELPESDTCCGSAGIYNLTQPELAGRLLERKVDFIAASGASLVATGNPGCIAWIQQGLKERGLDIAVKHPVEILDEVYAAEYSF